MKREDKEKMIAYGCVVPFLVCTAIFVVAVMRTALAHANEPERIAEPWQPPAIPKCEKELWLRIKDGCPKEDEDGA